MGLTRKMLRAMGIDDDNIDQIIEAHVEVKNERNERIAELEQKAATVDQLKKQLEDAKSGDDFEAMYEQIKGEFEQYKTEVAKADAAREKGGLYRKLLAEAGIDPKRIDSVMKVADLSGVEVKDGSITNAEALTDSIKSEWDDFIVKTIQGGANVSNPPGNGGSPAITKEKFAKMNLRERNQLYVSDRETYDSLVNS